MPKINFTEIPAVELRNLCRTFSAAIERSSEDPAFLEAYNQYIAGKEAETLTREKSNIPAQLSQQGA